MVSQTNERWAIVPYGNPLDAPTRPTPITNNKSRAGQEVAKKKRKPAKPQTPSRWDMGADGPANRISLIVEQRGDIDVETGKLINPNGVTGSRRRDMLAIWHKKGRITTAGYNAAERLRDAYEATLTGPGWSDNDRVQSSVRPDVAVAVQIDSISAFVEISRLIPAENRRMIDACVLNNHTPARLGYVGRRYQEGMLLLRDALSELAESLDRKWKRR